MVSPCVWTSQTQNYDIIHAISTPGENTFSYDTKLQTYVGIIIISPFSFDMPSRHSFRFEIVTK